NRKIANLYKRAMWGWGGDVRVIDLSLVARVQSSTVKVLRIGTIGPWKCIWVLQYTSLYFTSLVLGVGDGLHRYSSRTNNVSP
ncbi:hypothetical protein Tco_1544134, partial [Tanacetum coccineum]